MFTRKLPAGAGTLERRDFPVDLRKIWIFAAALIRAPNEAPLFDPTSTMAAKPPATAPPLSKIRPAQVHEPVPR